MSGKPSAIGGPFTPRLREMLKSPAYQSLGLSARRVLERLEIEHMDNCGKDNGNLVVTFDQFVEFGVRRASIGAAIQDLVVGGFVEITIQGHAGTGPWRRPNRFRITFLPANGTSPTHEWKAISGASPPPNRAGWMSGNPVRK
jgi:hypothetical protein